MRGGLLMIRTKRSSKAATLIELIIVLVLAGVIVAAVIGYFALARTSARVSGMVAQVGTIETQLLGLTNGGQNIVSIPAPTTETALSSTAFPALSPSFDTDIFQLIPNQMPNVKLGGVGQTTTTIPSVAAVAHTSTQVGSPTASNPSTPSMYVRAGQLEFVYEGIPADLCDRVARNMSDKSAPDGTDMYAHFPQTTIAMGARIFDGRGETGISVICAGTAGLIDMTVIFHQIGAQGTHQ